MLDALNAFREENVFIGFAGELKAIVIRSQESEELIQVVLPHRTY